VEAVDAVVDVAVVVIVLTVATVATVLSVLTVADGERTLAAAVLAALVLPLPLTRRTSLAWEASKPKRVNHSSYLLP
jgi:hypothetical protein